jgi:hypothetical protein
VRLRGRVPVVRWRISPGAGVSLYVRELVIGKLADDSMVGNVRYDVTRAAHVFEPFSGGSFTRAELVMLAEFVAQADGQKSVDDLAVIDEPIKFELEWCAECGTGFHAEECPVCGHLERVKQR